MNTSNLLIFLHIPKTAGSTMHHVLARQYPPEFVYSIDGDNVQRSFNTLRSLPEQKKEQLLCIKGHLPFGTHDLFLKEAKYITFLRDPANWVRSYYTFILSIPSHPLRSEVAACNNLKDFCSLLTEWGMDDFQCRALAGRENHDDIMPPYGPLPEDALNLAKKNIEKHFPVVGLVELFDESLLLWKKYFKWRNIRYLRQNVTRGKAAGLNMTGPQKELVYKKNPNDTALYQFAQKRLQKQIEAQGANFKKQVGHFQAMNSLFALVYPYYMMLGLNRIKTGCNRLIRLTTGGG